MAASSLESIEYQALARFLDKLATAFKTSLLTITNELFARGIIPRDVHDQVLTTGGVDDATKATWVVKSVLDQVLMCPEKYHDFMALPSFNDPCHRFLHEDITAVYGASLKVVATQTTPNLLGADQCQTSSQEVQCDVQKTGVVDTWERLRKDVQSDTSSISKVSFKHSQCGKDLPSNQTTKVLEMAVEVNVTIILSGEEYSIVEIPHKSSAVVIKRKQELLKQVDMKAFVEDLGRVGGFVRVAYNGATAAGPHFSALQVKIQKIGFEVVDLCDTSALTITKFRDASSSILDTLQSTYEYLIENEIDTALDLFKGILHIAQTMHRAAKKLQKRFEDEKKKVEETVTETISKRSETSIEAKRKEVERKRLEEEQKYQQEQLEKIIQSEEDAMEMFKHARESQEEALKGMANVGLWGTLIGKRRAYEKKADEMKEQRKEALQIMDKQCENRQKALAEIGEVAKKLIDCSEERENMDKAAVEALHQAEAGLRNLSIVMRQAANFWKHMEELCSQLAKPRVEKEFKAIRKKATDEERVKLFSSRPFKRGAVEFYALWVALNSVCAEYNGHIKQTQQKLYDYIRECPTYNQAKQNIGKLAKEFLADVESAQMELAEKRKEGELERKELEAPSCD